MQVVLIGRGNKPVTGQVVLDSRGVSGQHARAMIDPNKNVVILEDLGSTNGTFVNGFRIKRKSISHNDIIMMADQRLSLQQIFEAARATRDDPNDFSVEFGKLQNVWDNYQLLLKQARSNNGMDTFLTVCLLVAPALLLGPVAGAVVAGGAMGGTAVGSALGLAARELFSKNKTAKTQNVVTEIENDFKIQYVCPKCARSLYGFPYEYYKKQRQCIQCKAVWVKS
ncbi:FHA domain-containing protein [Runella zeae]|jgi:pSer/pThr/pTyr-binding forkhead associated (FHA) protein|uniref:FHA domain-containing protein n=1 Tax=Runella zeae TaxID=94255 RepID=UPI0004047046|nr:FHA domain-containing protein [Runella zeae]